MNEGCIKRKRNVGSLKQLDNIILLAFVFQLYLVLKIKCSLGIPIDIEVKQVAYLGIQTHLYVLVKIESSDTAAVRIKIVVIAEIVHYLERQISTSRRIDTDIGNGKQSVDFLADFAETRNTAQQSVVCGSVAHR